MSHNTNGATGHEYNCVGTSKTSGVTNNTEGLKNSPPNEEKKRNVTNKEKDKDERKHKKRNVMNKEKDKDERKHNNCAERDMEESERIYDDDFYPNLGPMPELGIPHWCYTMDTVIKDIIEGTEYTVRDVVEGKVDDNGHKIDAAK